MSLGQSDHGLQLSRGGRDAALLCPNVVTQLAHGDIGVGESLSGIWGQDRVDLGLGVGDVRRQEFDGLE
jgi:hypothetical protein